jgi:hypothetical protein
MRNPLDHPFFMLVLSLAVFWIASGTGAWLRQTTRKPVENVSEDFKFVLGGTLTLLGLIIGFTFSMAVNRYDLRKNYEEQEANAIGTEYVRADLLPAADAAKVRSLLKSYLDERMLKYNARTKQEIEEINVETARLQGEMWAAVSSPANAQPSPVIALAVAGMNDVLNSQGYTQAAWWNRIPASAWALLTLIAIFCNLLIGYGARHRNIFLFLILPIALSISFFLITDIDSPRGGLIRVHPQNLESLAESLQHSR